MEVAGLCTTWYIPVTPYLRKTSAVLYLTNGVTVQFDDMKFFQITVTPSQAATDDTVSPTAIHVRIGLNSGNVLTGQLDLNAPQSDIAGPSEPGGEFELALQQVRRVDFTS